AAGGDGSDIGAFESAVAAGADVSVTVRAASVVTDGTLLTYRMTIANCGPEPATMVTLTNMLPDLVTFVSSSAGCAPPSGGVLVCVLGTLAPGDATNVTVVVRPTGAFGDTSFTAGVSAGEPDPLTGNNSATAVTFVVT